MLGGDQQTLVVAGGEAYHTAVLHDEIAELLSTDLTIHTQQGCGGVSGANVVDIILAGKFQTDHITVDGDGAGLQIHGLNGVGGVRTAVATVGTGVGAQMGVVEEVVLHFTLAPGAVVAVIVEGIGLFGGEGMTEPMRAEMKKVWGPQFICTQNYGMSELCGPGVSGECTELNGMHINEDWFIPEVINPETGEVLPEGELGELVVTCLGKEALPMIRYRTKDLTRLHYEPCACGRTFCRMENLSGRSDDMLVIRGVNVFPTQIEEVLFKIDEIGPHYEILVERKNRLDVMTISVELIDDRLLDSYSKLNELEQRIRGQLKSALGLAAIIKLVAPNSLQRFEGKAKRVTDLRKDGL